MKMQEKDYIRIFNSFLDNDFLNSGILLNGSCLTEIQKMSILEYISLRSQVEFNKKVILLCSKEIDTELDSYTRDSDPYIAISENVRENPVYVCLFTSFSYFNDNTWEKTILQQLEYYRQTFFGFTNGNPISVIYEI